MTPTLPDEQGVAVFAGSGAWHPQTPGADSDNALVFSKPTRVLTADRPGEIAGLLHEVEAEQSEGRYVAGYLSYEAGAAFGLTVRASEAGARKPGAASEVGAASELVPLGWMAVYDPAQATVISASEWQELLAQVDVTQVAKTLAEVEPALSVSREEYVQAIGRVREYIAAGDTYQVNYTVRSRFELAGIGPLEYFLALVLRQPVPYAAYLDLGDAQIISLSPEMFLRREGRRLESRPMKGTRPRGTTHAEDVALAYELAETAKERAENLMIVDMVRSDLGRVSRAGSVRVPTLYAVEPYRTVWQMVSTVTGEAHPRTPLADLMRAVFPGASITGAPKHHTMEIIAELETEPRGVYTGAVGLFMPGGDFTTNIAIRTIVHSQGRCRLGIGSGVVWDSDAAAEYDETLAKSAFATPSPGGASRTDTPARAAEWRPDPQGVLRKMATQEDFYLFETVLLEAAASATGSTTDDAINPLHSLSEEAVLDRFRFLEEHLDRMAASARALALPFELGAAREVMVGLARVHPEALVARIQLDAAGLFSLSTREVPADPTRPVDLLVSPFRTDPDDPLLRHKTSLRGFYNREHRRALAQGCFDALFLSRLDRVTEGAISNVFARFDDQWVTPPLKDGSLPGIWRAWFLEQNHAAEASLSLEELGRADELVVGNSVRGAIRVGRLVTGPLMS